MKHIIFSVNVLQQLLYGVYYDDLKISHYKYYAAHFIYLTKCFIQLLKKIYLDTYFCIEYNINTLTIIQ